MGYKTMRTSDLSGKVLGDDEVVNVVVRGAPRLAEAKQFDCSDDELARLVTVIGLVSVTVHRADGTTEELMCTSEEFARFVPEQALASMRGVRGRRPGQRQRGN